MMKKILLFLLVLLCLVPSVCRAEMVGYVDTGRYVTETEKLQFPYNTIVDIDDNATGTIVSPRIILTCRHCIGERKNGDEINYTTTDGETHRGEVYSIKQKYKRDNDDGWTGIENSSEDYAFIVTKTPHNGPFLPVENQNIAIGSPVMLPGYGALRILSYEELQIIRLSYANQLAKYGNKVTRDNCMKILVAMLIDIDENHRCKFVGDTNCVTCSGEIYDCIFGDHKNLKVDESCFITKSREMNVFETDCRNSHGYSGAPIINRDSQRIVGVNVSGSDEIGYKKAPDGNAVASFNYANDLKELAEYLDK